MEEIVFDSEKIKRNFPFSGISSFGRFPFSRDLSNADVVIMGVPFDIGTTNRSGARMAPRSIRDASGMIMHNYLNWKSDDFNLREKCPCIIDYGDVGVGVGPRAIEYMMKDSFYHAKTILSSGACLLSLGGDHTIPYGLIRAAKEKYGKISLLHFDSHQDCVPSDGNYCHANFAYDLWEEGCIDVSHSAQIYVRSLMPNTPGYNIIYANEAIEMGPVVLASRIKEVVGDSPVYLTFDIDALDPAYAPGTGTPVPGGPSSYEIRKLLRLLDGINVVASDVVCVSPPYDHAEITALAAAAICHDLIFLMAKARDKRKEE